MARGQRGARSATAGNQNQRQIAAEEDQIQNNNSNKSSARGRRQKNVQEDEGRRGTDETPTSVAPAPVESKREHHPVKSAPQPTSEQLMIAQLIGGDNKADDPHQRQKIQKVMDITGLEEDAVATALFDAQWDEQRAIELLLEEAEQLTAWEETGPKKKKNKNKQAADESAKDDWDESDNFVSQDNREKSRSRGPPRMRRGGSQPMSGNRPRGGDHDDQQQLQYGGGGNQSRGQGPRRGDGLARRGGPGGSRGGGGGRSFQSRPAKPDMQSTSSGTAAFSGSIDTWNNPAPEAAASAAPDRTTGTAGAADPAPAGPKRMSRNSGGGKDAFDNAGNWGDDFPAADDWDNEEYTGSLADTKVFTARSGIGSGQAAKPTTAAAIVAARPPEQPTQQPQAAPQQPQAAAASSSTVIGQNRSFSATVNGPPPAAVSASPGVPQTSSYSQSIDLSTLLQKPTTQSTLSSPPLQQQQQSLLQFNQQATDSLRAGLGIGPNSSNKAPGNLNSYSAYTNSASAFSANPPSNSFGQGSAFTSIKSSQSPGSNNAPTNIQQRTSVPPQHAKGPAPSLGMPSAPTSTQVRPRMPPSSKIPSSAVEMPGDNIGQLDVQFGGLDLKFGSGSTIGLSSAVTMPSSVPSMSMSTPSSSSIQSASMPASSLSSVPMPSVTMPSKQISNGYQSSSSVLPKPSNSGSANSSVSAKPGQQQQQHQSDSLGSYSNYGNYGQQQQQSKPSYHHQYQNQYGGYSDQSSYQSSSTSGYGSQNSYSSSSTPSSGYKNSGNQYQHDSLNKFDSMSSSTSSMAVNNAAAAVLGLTTTTNALSGKVSATTAGKVPNVPNLPPGVASMLPQHFMTSLPPAAYYGIQQPSAAAAMYSAYGSGLDDLAALQRSAGLHTLVGASNNPTVPQPGGLKAPSSGYYDPSNQYAPGSLGGSRNDGSSNLNSQLGSNTSATTAAGSSGSNSNSDKTGFGSSVAVSSTDSNSSPIPSTGLQSGQSQQQQAAAQQATFNLAASNAFAAQQHMPPGYAYFYGGVPNLQYGAATAATGYPGALTVPTAGGGSSNSQFQKTYGYGSGYDNLGQAGSKDFSSNYSAGNGAGKSSAGGSQAPNAAGHQYWGNSPLASGQLW